MAWQGAEDAISGAGGLSKDEVARMVTDAESHAADDKSRRDAIDAGTRPIPDVSGRRRSRASRKIAVGELSKVEAAIADVRKALRGNDVDPKRATDALQRASRAG